MTKGAKNGSQQGSTVYDDDLTFTNASGATDVGTLTIEAFRRLRAKAAPKHVVIRQTNAPGVVA